MTSTLKVGLLLTRHPIIMAPLHPFTASYLQLKQATERTLARPFIKDMYFKKGTSAESKWNSMQNPSKDSKEVVQPMDEALLSYKPADKDQGWQSLDRMGSDCLYLIIREDNEWRLFEGSIGAEDTLLTAAEKNMQNSFGSFMDTWFVGGKPVGHLDDTFFLKSVIMAGKVVPKGDVEYRWMTKEECRDFMDERYFKSVGGMMS